MQSPKLYDAYQDAAHSSDDEPLSLHKTNKVEKERNKIQTEEFDNYLSVEFVDVSILGYTIYNTV